MGLHKDGISIIIPVHNEEKLIFQNSKKMMKFMDELKDRYELILCDDNSTDSTRSKLKEIKKLFPKKVRCFSNKKGGIGACFKHAVKIAKYDHILTFDIDLPIELDFVKNASRLLKKYDMVIGSKKLGRERRYFLRKFLSMIYILLVRIFLDLKYSDYSPSGKAYRKKSLPNLEKLNDGSFYTTELIFFMEREDKKIIEIPTNCIDTRISRFNIYLESLCRTKNILKTFFKFRIP